MIIDGLEPNQRYEMTVAAMNSNGVGPQSESIEVRTLELMVPKTPPKPVVERIDGDLKV